MEQIANKELVKATKIRSVEVFEPEVLNRELVKVNNVSQALALADKYPNYYPSLATIKKEYGGDCVERIIKLYLLELIDLVNLKRPLTEKHIEFIAMNVVAKHYALTIADVHVVFKKAINGDFGTFYESLDVPKVMKWFNDYFNQRCELAMDESINNQYYDKDGNKNGAYYERYYSGIKNKFKRF